MKRITLLTFALLLGLSMQAQITINPADIRLSPNGDTILSWIYDVSQVTLPQFGTDLTWDYSTTAYTGSVRQTQLEGGTHPDFPTATMRMATTVTFLGIDFPTYNYLTLDGTGLHLNGIIDPEITLPIGSITGVPTDSVRIVGGGRVETPARPFFQLPMSYGDSSLVTNYSNINYFVTATPFNLFDFNARQQVKREVETQMVGWGEIALLDPSTSIVDTFETLLQYQVVTRIDSFFDAANNPLPAALLTPLGFTQGSTYTNHHYGFFIPGADYYGAYFFVVDGVVETAICNQSVFTNATPVSTKAPKANFVAHSIYPNPIQNEQFQIELDKNNSENWTLEIFNIMGQSIHNELITENFSTIRLSNNLPAGQYFYRVQNENKQTVARGKLMK